MHDAQEHAIAPILAGDTDVVIAAATAAGKTEAAFLPICSAIATDCAPPAETDQWAAHDPWANPPDIQAPGVQVLYISPLKALINDQYNRLEQICETAGIAVHRWHGDVSGSAKQNVLRKPSGVLLITPESLEAMFVIRGSQVPTLFAGLRYVVVDEMHSFLATARGAQLQSLLHRLELAIRRRCPRIGLSATIGDMSDAAAFVRPGDAGRVTLISSASDGRELRLQLRGYIAISPASNGGEDDTPGEKAAIADHLFRTLRGRDNLVFANARRDVETYADLLARRSEADRVPNEFWPHHGSLSKESRESVEEMLKDPSRPATAICTSTLEMGIDIGSVSSVAQIGPPPSVASLRQRLGRSGRRDDPSVVRIYTTEAAVDMRSELLDQLRCNVVQSVAMVRLMLNHWVESPDDPGYNYSTLIQQVLSTIAQHGGARAADLHRALCGPGPFELVDSQRFVRVLRAMAAADLITQASDGSLLPGVVGERHLNHYDFYTAFVTGEEWRLVADGRTIGSMPVFQPLFEGVMLIFGGKRWKVISVDQQSRVVELARAKGGNPPVFGGHGSMLGDRVRQEMAAVYADDDQPVWLDATASELLNDGRIAWHRFAFDRSTVLAAGNSVAIVPWCGDKALFTASLALLSQGIEAEVEGPALITHADAATLTAALHELLATGLPSAEQLARHVKNHQVDKWDWVLDDDLSYQATAARRLNVAGATAILSRASADLAAVNLASAAPVQLVRSRALCDQLFCVLDLETTGFSPRLGDRVLEIATVRMRGDGTVLDEWSTLINPGRDVGPTHVHGITASEVVDAPTFADILGDLLHRLDGAVLVAHNIRFDRQFLAAEFERAGLLLPAFPSLCTLSLGGLLQPGGASRRLGACCERLGIDLTEAHAALADALATGRVLAAYLAIAEQQGQRTLDAIGCVPLEWPSLPRIASTDRTQSRGRGSQRIELQGQYLARLVGELADDSVADVDKAAYLELLDRALEDRRLTEHEAAVLADTAREWGLTQAQVAQAHSGYFDRLITVANADGVITTAERADLVIVAQLLGLCPGSIDQRAGNRAEGEPLPLTPQNLTGQTVCFTGALIASIDGVPVTRARAQELAQAAGLVIKENVSRGLDILVVADPDSQSGKAKRAHDLGTRVLAEAVFWPTIGVAVD